MFSELDQEEILRLDEQRTLVESEMRRRYGRGLNKSTSDHVWIQKLVDDRAFEVDAKYEWQSVGVCFGDALAGSSGLAWVICTDEYGRDPVLRYQQTSIQLNALTVISKRIERGDQVDVAALAAALQRWVGERAAQLAQSEADTR